MLDMTLSQGWIWTLGVHISKEIALTFESETCKLGFLASIITLHKEKAVVSNGHIL